jgi:hypothetical protein
MLLHFELFFSLRYYLYIESVFCSICQQMLGITLRTSEEHFTLIQSNALFVDVVHEVCVLRVWQTD